MSWQKEQPHRAATAHNRNRRQVWRVGRHGAIEIHQRQRGPLQFHGRETLQTPDSGPPEHGEFGAGVLLHSLPCAGPETAAENCGRTGRPEKALGGGPAPTQGKERQFTLPLTSEETVA
jgi:hypothetical protein